MKNIRSNLRVLLAQKETREGRSISLREVQRETGVPISTILGLANNTAKAVSLESISALCNYLECNIANLLSFEEIEGNNLPLLLTAA